MWICWEKTVFIFIIVFHPVKTKKNIAQHKRDCNKRCSLLLMLNSNQIRSVRQSTCKFNQRNLSDSN